MLPNNIDLTENGDFGDNSNVGFPIPVPDLSFGLVVDDQVVNVSEEYEKQLRLIECRKLFRPEHYTEALSVFDVSYSNYLVVNSSCPVCGHRRFIWEGYKCSFCGHNANSLYVHSMNRIPWINTQTAFDRRRDPLEIFNLR